MISDLDRLSKSRPLPFLHVLLHEVKPTSEAGPLGEQANTGPSLCLGPWRYARKENRGGNHAYLIRTYISLFQGRLTGT